MILPRASSVCLQGERGRSSASGVSPREFKEIARRQQGQVGAEGCKINVSSRLDEALAATRLDGTSVPFRSSVVWVAVADGACL